MAVKRTRNGAGGGALVIALLLLPILASLSVALISSSSMNLAQSSNLAAMTEARLAGEGGVSFMLYKVSRCGVSGSLRGQALLDSLAAKLGAIMTVSYNTGKTAITVADTGLGDGKRSFGGLITLSDPNTLHMVVTGKYAAGAGLSSKVVQRELAIDLHPTWDPALAFGICSKGPVEMGMNTDLSGITNPKDGSIYSAAIGSLAAPAVSCGSGHISGDVSLSPPNTLSSLDLSGTTVDGTIRIDAPPVTMPTIDRTPYKSLATTVMNLASPPAGTYKNIRIPPNTNPTFNDSVTIQGVMYVQAPNKIYFNNNCTFAGVMVADDPPAGSLDADNYIYFKNNMTFSGVGQLPDTSDFSQLRKLPGSSILCPGFTMEFKNNMNSVAGILALKSLIAKNNVNSTIYGSVLIYGNTGLDFKNNSDLNIQLSGSTPPAGFEGYGLAALMPDPATYAEK
jgi:hypothetical protein